MVSLSEQPVQNPVAIEQPVLPRSTALGLQLPHGPRLSKKRIAGSKLNENDEANTEAGGARYSNPRHGSLVVLQFFGAT
jgi:hypothetical protein